MISVIINTDTRPARGEHAGLFHGTVSRDYLVDGLLNKKKFFEGFDCEFIVYIDEHQRVDALTLDTLREHCQTIVLSRHSKHYRGIDPFNAFNDVNYLRALSMARGNIICHFDQDVAAFTSSPHEISSLINMVVGGQYKFVSLPSPCSPHPVDDASFQNKWWASTRFFICERDSIDLTALEHAIREPQWAYQTYGFPPRQCPWTEHFLGLMNGFSVYYPPVTLDTWAAFPWAKYEQGALAKLNALPYGEIAKRLYDTGGLPYDGVDASLLKL